MESSALSNNVVVAVRIRPLSVSEISGGQKSCCEVFGTSTVAIKKSGDASQYLKSQQLSINEYAYDVVFGEKSTQREVYDNTAKAYIPRVLNGENVTIFAYGATGAGKTHTLFGNTRADRASERAEAGIIPNSIQDIFKLLTTLKKTLQYGEQYQVITNFLEVYNEQVYDLLDSSGKVLSVREDQERGIVVVAGITDATVETYDQVIELIMQGNRRRKTEATMANAVSSRSHAVLQVIIRHVSRTENGRELMTESRLSLIDLAGSERASATNNRGARLQEGANINKSLLALANCINSLSEKSTNGNKKATNVKYRDSKLTHLLKSSLEGNCNLVMIANVNPSDVTYEDSHNTLKYANRAKNIKVNPAVKETTIKDSTWVEREHRLREENRMLKGVIEELRAEVRELRSLVNLPPSESFQQQCIADSSASIATREIDQRSHDQQDQPEDLDQSMSSLSTAADTACDGTAISSIELPSSMLVESIEDVLVDLVPDVLYEPHAPEEPAPINPRKRRASHLPTPVLMVAHHQAAGSSSNKRRSIAIMPSAPAAFSVAAVIATPTEVIDNAVMESDKKKKKVFRAKIAFAKPEKSLLTSSTEVTEEEEVLMPKLSEEPACFVHAQAESEEMIAPLPQPKVSTSHQNECDDINLAWLDMDFSSESVAALPPVKTRRASVSSTKTDSRRRSIAKVNAMLDNLSKDVTQMMSTRRNSMQASLVNPLTGATISEGGTVRRTTRSSMLSNKEHADEDNVSSVEAGSISAPVAANTRRKSLAVAAAAVDAVAASIGNGKTVTGSKRSRLEVINENDAPNVSNKRAQRSMDI